MRQAAGLLLIAAALSLATHAGDRIYVPVAPAGATGDVAVQIFDIDAAGLPAFRETVETRGKTDRDVSLGDPTISRGFLFVQNTVGGTITVLAIDPEGTLTEVPGSPFATGGGLPVELAPHPTLPIVYASLEGAGGGTAGVFSFDDAGTLTREQAVPAPAPRGLAIRPDGGTLYVTQIFLDEGLRAFDVSTLGLLDELDASPFPFDSSRPSKVLVASNGERVFVLDVDSGIAVFDADTGGVLDLVAGAPFPTDVFTTSFALTPDDEFLYVGVPFRPFILGYAVRDDGTLELLPTSPNAAEYLAVTLLHSADHPILYQVSTDTVSLIQPFAVGDDGSLTRLADPLPIVPTFDRVPLGAVFAQAGGACCVAPHSARICVDGLTLDECEAQQGLFVGEGSTCTGPLVCDALLVTMRSLSAELQAGGVMVRWSTSHEVDTAGFRVLRHARGAREKSLTVVSGWIPVAGNALEGASYEYLDDSRQALTKPVYYVEDIDNYGKRTRHGPILFDRDTASPLR